MNRKIQNRILVALGILVALSVGGVVFANAVMRQPQSNWVSTSSRMILPSTQITNYTGWAASTAYTYGNVVTNGQGSAYWCVGAGTSGTSVPTSVSADVTDNTVTWRLHNRTRNQLIIVNDSFATIYLAFGYNASTNTGRAGGKGIRLNANGGTFNAVNSLGYCPQGQVNGIADSAGSNNVCIQEF